jgi:TRAP-type uncharacterized transport system substrate-binding protein
VKVPDRSRLAQVWNAFMRAFGLSSATSLIAILLIVATLALGFVWFSPTAIIMTSGPEGSIFRTNAERYGDILARNGVKLRILSSEGSLENLHRLVDPLTRVDVGFVQGGVAAELNIQNIVSLGSVSYEPLPVFYRGGEPLDLLSQLDGKQIAIATGGSRVRPLALALVSASGIVPGGTTALADIDAEDAANALVRG